MHKFANNSSGVLTIWDSDSDCLIQAESILLWRQFANQQDARSTASICQVIEDNHSVLREKILRLIFDVGSSVRGNPKTQHHIRTGFDYFWMTQFHSRPYTQSAQLNNLAKLFALFEILQENKTKKLVVYSNNKSLSKVFASISRTLQIEFQTLRVKNSHQNISAAVRIKKFTPRPLLAIAALLTQIKTSIALKQKPTRVIEPNSISFFDYWYRFADSVNTDRKFASQYWSRLVEELDQTEINWWHNLVDQNKLSELNTARSLLTDFNQHPRHFHKIVDARVSFKIVLRSIVDHGRLFIKSIPGKKFAPSFVDPNTGINFWPLFRREWLNSYRGYEALLNCLRFNRLESLISTIPHQKLGVYLIENQPWEMAMIHLWRRFKHGKLIGVAHSTVRFWDLRLMSDMRQFNSNSVMPRPDCIAVNGNLAKSSLLKSGYPASEIVEVEALMYLHLSAKKAKQKSNSPKTILVATDYLDSATRAQLRLLEEVVALHPSKYQILLKPHWSQSLENFKFESEVVSGKKDLSHFFDQADVLYCSAITSAVIDGVCSGLPVIQCLDPMSFNLSPLRENIAVQTVRTSAELVKALDEIEKFATGVDPNELFNLDSNLPKWKSLLEI
jgi:surface carbohydrate biosynthesis protein (TIGR04326 family)